MSVEIAPQITVPTGTVQRPHRADARRNFDALLTAGRAAFAENGAEASLEDIARRAGVGIGTLYRNFPTRDALIETLYLDEIAALVRVGAESTTLEPWQALTSWLRRFVEYANTKKALIEGLNKESEVLKQCRVVLYGAGEPVLRRAQAAGAARSDTDITDVVHMVSGIAGVTYADDAQRERVLLMAIDGLRA
ncbi:TetR/AcrR family transcriptional regulator [Lysinimonas soli]|uniref:TetR/AcrR family transcriptional regulator n=1 Tax=Lysinimonas soli TaxID=1074233 RepID=A0ABW0NLS7_9MICO